MPKRAPLSVTPPNPWVKGIYPGTHTAMSGQAVTFTAADVSNHVEAVKRQLGTGYMPPLVKGHPKHDDPRVGSVVDVKLEGDAAWYKVDHLTPAFSESCQRGEYMYSSPMLNRDSTIRHLGALGAWNPSLKDQPPMAIGEEAFGEAVGGEDQGLAFGMEADWGTVVGSWLNRIAWRLKSLGGLLRRQREALIEKDGIEAADKLYPTYEIETLEKFDVPYDLNPGAETESDSANPAFGEKGVEGQGAVGDPSAAGAQKPAPPVPPAPAPAPVLPEPTAEVLELKNKLDEANRQLAVIQNEATSKAFGEKLNKAAAEGRLSPVMRAEFESIHKELMEKGGLAFGEADLLPQALYKIVDALPQVVAFGELGEGKPFNTQTTNPIVADAEKRAAAAKELR